MTSASPIKRHRVGLLGGTFDPVHLGHLVVAEHLLVDLDLDEVRLVVAGAPWMKGRVTDGDVRVAMAQAAVAGVDGIVVDDRECRRDGPTFTADTLAELRDGEPDTDFFFCLGSDAAGSLHRWERVHEVLELATIVVVSRPGFTAAADPSLTERLRHLEVPALAISSTDIRRRYAEGRAARFLVPVQAHQQIVERGLYLAGHG